MQRSFIPTIPTETVSHNPAIGKKVMVRSGEIPHLTNFSQAVFPIGSIAPAHAHADMYEVFFVDSGRGSITIDGTEQSLTPGVCVTVAPGEVHEVSNTGDSALILTYFGVKV
jgi:quercetin dioxygenase-like cupin family protein